MKHKIFAVAILALPLSACGAGSTLDTAFSVVTTTVTNPITSTDIYRIKNVYAAADQLGSDYRNYCWSTSYAVLMKDPIARPLCQNRRPVTRTIKAYKDKASLAINKASTFIRENPTLNAATLVNAAWAAVTEYQNYIPKIN